MNKGPEHTVGMRESSQTPPESCTDAFLDPSRLTGPLAPGPKPCPALPSPELCSSLLNSLAGLTGRIRGILSPE